MSYEDILNCSEKQNRKPPPLDASTPSWHWLLTLVGFGLAFSRTTPPISLIVSPLSRYLCRCSPQTVRPPLAGGVEVNLKRLSALALVNPIWCHIVLLGVEPGPETFLWCGEACLTGFSWSKRTQILLLLHGLGFYFVSCQNNFFAHRHKVAIFRSVSWSVYELDDWGTRAEFPVGEEIFVFSTSSGPIVGPTKYRFHWVPRSLPRR
jgi:hypothetical protein